MAQPQGQLLPREARRSRPRQVARQRFKVGAPLALRERVFELELAVEMVLDDGLVAAGDEYEMFDAASRASSTTCWINGRSTTGSISFGMAFVAGRNLVPSPATGKTALRMGFMSSLGL